MPGFADLMIQSRPIEYFILHDPTPIGRRIGIYENKSVHEAVVDAFGRRYDYAGIAPRRWDGRFDVDGLQTGEFILRPGLIYRYKPTKKSWWEWLVA